MGGAEKTDQGAREYDVAAAAERMAISPRRVRLLCHDQLPNAWRDDDGAWHIPEADIRAWERQDGEIVSRHEEKSPSPQAVRAPAPKPSGYDRGAPSSPRAKKVAIAVGAVVLSALISLVLNWGAVTQSLGGG